RPAQLRPKTSRPPMTRLEELALKNADDSLTPEETVELQALLNSSGSDRELYLGLLNLEATLRTRRTNLDLTESTLERLRKTLHDSVEARAMQNIRAIAANEQNPEFGGARLQPSLFKKEARRTSFPPISSINFSNPVLLALAASIALLLALGFWFFGARMGSP